LRGLETEPRLFCTETLFGDWAGQTLLLAKDAAPVDVIRARLERGETHPWRHSRRGHDPMGYVTNERVSELAELIHGGKLYGSALAHMLKVGSKTSSSLMGFRSGALQEHLAQVLEFVVDRMANLRAIVCLGADAHWLVSSCITTRSTGSDLAVGKCADAQLFDRRILIGRLHHPSRAFAGGLGARRNEWRAVASEVNSRIASTSCRKQDS
jgi:hypothetical protein